MKNTLTNIIIFAAGAAIGSAVTWKILDDRYEKLIHEETKAIKEVYSEESKIEEEPIEKTEEPAIMHKEVINTKPDILQYAAQITGHNYANYASPKEEVVEESEVDDVEKPYVISPDEFGENDDYETISLIYFADKYLTDDDYEIVDDIDNTVGRDSLTHFGEYEDDSVFVRNDVKKCDYEILLDLRKYSEVINKSRPQ